jgi:hypothetical protein
MQLEHLIALGQEFRRRGMKAQARKLRLFYLATKYGLLDRRDTLEVHWSDELCVQWMQALRVPPHEHDLVERPRGATCRPCSTTGATPSKRTVHVWEGGARFRCATCGDEWVEH